MQNSLEIRGARVHNLKNVSLRIPHEQFTVITGVSGSGKSSLAFDTVYAEGQRRYVESLSAYARQFLERMEKPDVDEIDGIAPAVAIRQKNTTRNPRSTVATSTELYDFLRLLFARAGETWCGRCQKPVLRDSVDRVAVLMLDQPEGSRWYVLFPARLPEGHKSDRLAELRRKGFSRLYQNGTIFEFSTPESLIDLDLDQPVFVLTDRLSLSADPDLRQRLVDSVEICYREGGEAIFEPASGGAPLRFNEAFECKTCGQEFAEPEPRLFSFNSPFGACPRCQGFGNTVDYDFNLIVPDPSLPLEEEAIRPWRKDEFAHWHGHLLRACAGRVRVDVPYAELTPQEKDFVYRGDGKGFPGIRGFFEAVEKKKYKLHVRVFLSKFRGYTACPDCGGSRLRSQALAVRVAGRTIQQVTAMNIAEAKEFFDTLALPPEQSAIASKVLVEIQQRLKFLYDVGLDYLTLDRLSSTLSGGEAQRIQLATCLGSRLVGACYVLDEPSIGLHCRDTARLVTILHELRDLGNTILVVEHDADVMRAADYIVDLGPGAGEQGGEVVFAGPYQRLIEDGAGSLTGAYLRGERKVTAPERRRTPDPERTLRFYGARVHNLKNVDVEVPLGLMTVMTGVSGSGKSTLVHDVIHQSLKALRQNSDLPEEIAEDDAPQVAHVACDRLTGAQWVRELVLIDQTPIGRTPRSNPITYIQAFDLVRQIFANTEDSKRRGYAPGHFSFNVPGGRCEVCQGDGTVKVEMQFLADVELICEECRGTRFKSGVLEVRYQGLNIHEALQLTVDEAIGFFAGHRRLVNRLEVLADVGLGYLRLGQSATTLSGGEAQRVKLASHLAMASCEGTLFILDEPTTGLHFEDIATLLAALQRLVENGGSLLIIEHNLDVIRAADWVIDLGPEGGHRGGEIVAVGPPEAIAACERSWTGRFLYS
ncbi:MAG: excinuclease ABC subunit UvrA [Bryobacterales bacterium]|nr:excinuclease ABC subunit UvrA [Bryobacterales bacterium]